MGKTIKDKMIKTNNKVLIKKVKNDKKFMKDNLNKGTEKDYSLTVPDLTIPMGLAREALSMF